MLRRILHRLWRWFFIGSGHDWQRDRYLSQARDLSELEHRMNEWERIEMRRPRMHHGPYGFGG